MKLSERLRAGVGTAEDWFRDRAEDIAQAGSDWEPRAHKLYGDAVRAGREVVARTEADLRDIAKAHGAKSREGGSRPASKRERIVLDAVKATSADVAQKAGNAAGLVTGTLQAAEDLKDTAVLVARLVDPADKLRSPRGQAAVDQLTGAALKGVDYAQAAVADPGMVVRDVRDRVSDIQRDIDPSATPKAPSFPDELQRNFAIGRKQGELLVDVGSFVGGGVAAKAIAKGGKFSNIGNVAKYAEQGFTPRQAARLAEPYDGWGHHSPLPRRAKLPDWLGGTPIPDAIIESPFNIVKRSDISTGDFYELHHGVDGRMTVARVPEGGVWNGKVLGMRRYSLPERLWHGTPAPTKLVLGAGGIAGAAELNEATRGKAAR